MHYTGEIYRPPMEADTYLFEVTTGCSYNKCAFCSMYRKTPFSVVPEEQMIEDLEELKPKGDRLRRLFLLNGDPFVLSTEKLLHISELIKSYLPLMQTLTCYASIRDIRDKSVEELKALRAAGYNELYIGLETGYAPALELIGKGFTIEEARESLAKLKEADMRYIALLMGGIGGKGNSEASISATASLMNEFPPKALSFIPTSVVKGTELARLRDEGKYVELTEREQLEEEIMFLEKLNLDDHCFFYASHYYNLVPVANWMDGKDKMIAEIRAEMAEMTPAELDVTLYRGGV